MKKNHLILFSSIIGFAAIIIQMFASLEHSFEKGRTLALALNIYFSYFTVLSNIIVATCWGGVALWPQSKLSIWFKNGKVNTAICLYILIVGLIFYTLLYNTWDPQGWEYFATHAMHFYVPLMYFYLWFTEFREGKLAYKNVYSWLFFPLAYFGYLMIRGQLIGLYPYFFVDIGKFGGLKIAGFTIAISIFFIIVGMGLIYIDRKFVKKII